MGILLRTQTKALQQGEGEGEDGGEEALPLHAPQAEEGATSSLVAVVGEGVSPAVLEADRTRDYRARHPHPQGQGQREGKGKDKQAAATTITFCGVMRAAAGADKLRVRVVCCLAWLGMRWGGWGGTYLCFLIYGLHGMGWVGTCLSSSSHG